MANPKLAEVINPRLALQRRMEAEKQSPPALPDMAASSPVKFGRKYTPEEKARQQRLLVDLLKKRDAASSPTP